MLSKAELYQNINTEYQISKDYLKESRYELNRHIIDICHSIRVSNDVASIAMALTNYFFVKKCYFNYEKLTLACAAILLASKQENSQNRFSDISQQYTKITDTLSERHNVITAEDIQKSKDKISSYEITLLRTLNFEIKIELPFNFIYVYSTILYPENEMDLIHVSERIANDSFFTFANNVYKSYIVAIASIIIGAKYLEIPTIFDKEFKHIDNMRKVNVKGITEEEFEKRLLAWENKPVEAIDGDVVMEGNEDKENREYFDKLTLTQKIHPKMSLQDLCECVEMIMEYYNDGVNYVNRNNNKKGVTQHGNINKGQIKK